MPQGHTYQVHVDEFCQEVAEKSGGRLTIEMFYDKQLPYKTAEYTAIVRDRIVETAYISPSRIEGHHIGEVIDLPWLSPNGTLEEAREIFAIARPHVNRALEMENQHYPDIYYWPSQNIYTVGEIGSLSDLKGLRIRGYNKIHLKGVETLGAAPITLATTEVYPALQKKVIDGTITSAVNVISTKLYEVLTCCYRQPLLWYAQGYPVNNEAWNELPEDLQKIFLEAHEKLANTYNRMAETRDAEDFAWLAEEAGMTIVEPPAADRAGIRKLMKPVWEEWAKSAADEGGIELLEEILKHFGE